MLTAEDELAIAKVLGRYCHLIDAGRAEGLASQVFAPDARLEYGQDPTIGSEAITRFFTAGGNKKFVTAHFVSTFQIEEEGGQVRSSCYYQAWRWAPETACFGPLRAADSVSIGAYDDVWVKLDAGWRIVHRTLRILGAGPIGMGRASEALAPMWAERARKAVAAG